MKKEKLILLSDKGWHELKKVGLTKEEIEWFERHRDLPFYSFDKNFSTEAYKKAKIWSNYEEEEWVKCVNRLSKAYRPFARGSFCISSISLCENFVFSPRVSYLEAIIHSPLEHFTFKKASSSSRKFNLM